MDPQRAGHPPHMLVLPAWAAYVAYVHDWFVWDQHGVGWTKFYLDLWFRCDQPNDVTIHVEKCSQLDSKD